MGPVTDIAGAAADARAALAGAAADTAVAAADAWAALAGAAADTAVAAVDVLEDVLIRQATFAVALAASSTIAASTSPAPIALAAASDFEASGQDMTAVGPVQAPVSSSTWTRPPSR